MHTPARNGGFPEPPAGEPQRLVRVRHSGCGAQTRVRLPRAVPARAVRHVVCERCESAYDCEAVEEIWPPSPLWRWGALALAAIAVAGALWLLVGGGSGDETGAPAAAGPQASANAASDAVFASQSVVKPGYSLSLPPGWKQVRSKRGAAFAARALDGMAQATLWIKRNPELSFKRFTARSLDQLRSLAGSAEVVERIQAPTVEGRVVRLRADAPPESGVSAPYEVTLRAAGPYRYYLSTTVLPGASQQASDGADLIHASFIPRPQ